jgi:hypothetical protein
VKVAEVELSVTGLDIDLIVVETADFDLVVADSTSFGSDSVDSVDSVDLMV